MDTPAIPLQHKAWQDLLRLGFWYLLLCNLSLYLARQPGSLAFIAFANGYALAHLLHSERRFASLLLIFCLDAGSRFAHGQEAMYSLGTSAINLLQIALSIGIANLLRHDEKIEQHPGSLLRFTIAVCCIAPLLGASAITLLLPQANAPWERIWSAWFAGSCIGGVALLPATLVLERQGWRQTWAQCDGLRLLASAMLIVAVTILAALELPFPLVYQAGCLVVTAIFLPFVEASLLVALMTLITTVLLADGSFIPPPMISYWQILFFFLPVFLTQIPPLLLAASINQAKTREIALAASERAAHASNAENAILYENLLLQQQANLDSANKMQAIVQHAADAIITCDIDGKIESFNAAAEKMYQWQAAEVLGQSITQFWVEDGRQMQSQPDSGETYLEIMHQRRDGSHFPAELVTRQFSVSGQIKFVTLVRDVSERRRVERLKNDFIATVSHELRTPLTSIRGSLGLVLGGITGEMPTKAKTLLQIASFNTERLSRLVNDLLDLQQIEDGRLPFQFAAYPLPALLEECYSSNQAHAQKQQLTLHASADVPPVMVWVDIHRCLQILGHLLSNACKFSAPGTHIEIIVSLLNETQVRITIADQGCGIESAQAARIFQKFSQGDSSDTKAKGGTGIGLALAAGLARRMHASLSFVSVVHQGSQFFLDLPIARQNAAENASK